MTKFEYMSELEGLLLDISIEERQAALKYYDDYFEDSDEDSVDAIIQKLGAPVKVAAIIKSDLYYDNNDRYSAGGEFTENGYVDKNIFNENSEKQEVVEYYQSDSNFDNSTKEYTSDQSQKVKYETRENKKSSNLIIIILAVIFSPLILPLLLVLFSMVIAVVALIIGLFVALSAMVLAIGTVSVGLIVIGFLNIIVFPFGGMTFIGTGFILMAFAILCLILVKNIIKLIPKMFKGMYLFIKRIFGRRSMEV